MAQDCALDWRFLALCNLPQDFSLPQAGDSVRCRHELGIPGLWSRPRLLPRKTLAPTTKRNRMTHRPHGVKIEAEVVDGIQALRQNLIGGIEMPEVSPGIAPAHPAAAICIQRPWV